MSESKFTLPARHRGKPKRAPVVTGDVTRLVLTRGQVAVIDTVDLPLVGDRTWMAVDDHGKWYASAWYGGRSGKSHYLHRVLFGNPSGIEVEHADGDGLNCRRSNLRLSSHSQNCANTFKSHGTTSRYKGVAYRKSRRKWVANISSGGRVLWLGTFCSEEEAARAYDEAAIARWGEFARVNFPVGDQRPALMELMEDGTDGPLRP